jgi:hypothetical protein
MKKALTFCIILFATAIISHSYAQLCTPMHPGYTIVPDSGILLPKPLPHAAVGYPYAQTLTIGIPSTAQGFTVIAIQYNHISSFLTPLNTWTAINEDGTTTFPFWSDLTWHCVTLTGTPVTPGVDSLMIYVNVTVNLGFPYTQNNTKGFTVPIVVDDVTAIDEKANLATQLIGSHPNPFSDKTQLGLTTCKTEKVTLNVYTHLGQLVYSETKTTTPGENYFMFSGNSLAAGTYIYTVVTSEKMFREKLLKTE